MRLSDIYEGQTIMLDGGFDCVAKGEATVLVDQRGSLYFKCSHGEHFIDGQVDIDGELIGISEVK